MRQYAPFKAVVPVDFSRKMVEFWRKDENADEATVRAAYYDNEFKALAKRIAGTCRTFTPDLGYVDEETEGALCFEDEDNNVVIPVSILEVIA